MADEYANIPAFLEAYLRSHIRETYRPVMVGAGDCPLVDSAGNDYEWSRICFPPYALTGAVIDTEVQVGSSVVGSGILLEPRVVLTSARILQNRSLGALRFQIPVRPGEARSRMRRRVVAKETPRTGVRYGDPMDLGALFSLESSDIALLRLEDPVAGEMPTAPWVNIGLPPDPVMVGHYRRNPDARCEGGVVDCARAWADAVIPSYYTESDEFLTPVQWLAVPTNGSVVVVWTDHHPGDTSSYKEGASYNPTRDRGAPVVAVGSMAIRPEVVGVVSGSAEVPDEATARSAGLPQGVYYRVTRCDRWSGWVADTMRDWFGGGVMPPVPDPIPPGPGGSPPLVRRPGYHRRKGSIVASVATLGAGSLAAILAAR